MALSWKILKRKEPFHVVEAAFFFLQDSNILSAKKGGTPSLEIPPYYRWNVRFRTSKPIHIHYFEDQKIKMQHSFGVHSYSLVPGLSVYDVQ